MTLQDFIRITNETIANRNDNENAIKFSAYCAYDILRTFPIELPKDFNYRIERRELLISTHGKNYLASSALCFSIRTFKQGGTYGKMYVKGIELYNGSRADFLELEMEDVFEKLREEANIRESEIKKSKDNAKQEFESALAKFGMTEKQLDDLIYMRRRISRI